MSSELSYIWGQCTYYVAKTLNWIPPGLGNAADWWTNAPSKGIPETQNPAPGEVVVYGAGNGYSQFGHVGVVQKVYADHTIDVAEMNFKGIGVTDVRHDSSLADVKGFLVDPAGVAAGAALVGGSGAGTGVDLNPIDAGTAIANLPNQVGAMVHNAEEAMLTFSIGVGLFILALLLIGVGLYAIVHSDSEGGTKIVPIPV